MAAQISKFLPDDTDTKMHFLGSRVFMSDIVSACLDNWGNFDDIVVSTEKHMTPHGPLFFITITKVE